MRIKLKEKQITCCNRTSLYMNKAFLRCHVHNRKRNEMVKNIFLIRHADALLPETGQRDFDRRLSETGRKQALLLGEHIEALHMPIQSIYTSPSFRTLETTLQVTSQLKDKPRLVEAEEFYAATEKLMIASITRLDDLFETVAVIAHNPAIGLAFEYFSGEHGRGYSPATCAWLQFEIDSWKHLSMGMGQVKDFYYPGSL